MLRKFIRAALMAFALLSHTVAQGTSSGVTTGAIDTTGATLIVFIVAYFGVTPTTSDSKSNDATKSVLTARTTGSQSIRIWYYDNPASVGTGHTFTATGGFPGAAVLAFSGYAASSGFDVENGAASAAVSTLSTGSVTPAGNNELLVYGVGGAIVGTVTVSDGDTNTVLDQLALSAGVAESIASAYSIQTTGTTRNPAFSWTGAVGAEACIAAFKAATGGAAVYRRLGLLGVGQ